MYLCICFNKSFHEVLFLLLILFTDAAKQRNQPIFMKEGNSLRSENQEKQMKKRIEIKAW
jgi:hypothetical protein